MIANIDGDWKKLKEFPVWKFGENSTYGMPKWKLKDGKDLIANPLKLEPLRDEIIKTRGIALEGDIPTQVQFSIHHCTEEVIEKKNLQEQFKEHPTWLKLIRKYWVGVEVERCGAPNMYAISVYDKQPDCADMKNLLLSCPWYGLSKRARFSDPSSSNDPKQVGDDFGKRQKTVGNASTLTSVSGEVL